MFISRQYFLCLALRPAYLIVLVIQQLASVTTIHPYFRVKVGVTSCGGICFGTAWSGAFKVAWVF